MNNFTTHLMDLNDSPFNFIKSKIKTVEMRLNDEKRKLLKVGDHIFFINNKTQEELEVKIIKITAFSSFKEIYENYEKSKLGYLKDEKATYEDMYYYYSKEKIEKYGVLAIEIELI